MMYFKFIKPIQIYFINFVFKNEIKMQKKDNGVKVFSFMGAINIIFGKLY